MPTKKVKSASRFGARYGKRVRQRVIDVEKKQRQKHECPYCYTLGAKRIAPGIWFCKKCDLKFTGKAYEI